MNNDKEENRILKKFIWYNIIAFFIIILVIFIRQYLIQTKINNDMYSSNIINISGKQRMRSQQISKDIYALLYYKNQADADYYREELSYSIESWEKEYANLKNGVIDEKFTIKNSETIQILFSDLEGNYQAIIDAAKNILNIENFEANDNITSQYVNIISENESFFLEGMDKIVDQYNQEVVNKMTSLANIELILFFVLIGTVVFQLLFIFFPEQSKLKKAFQEIRYLSYHDRLTGIYNRYLFEQKVFEEVKRANSNNDPLSLVMLDLDHFKNVNDTWGHPVGDIVLKRTAQIAQSLIRKNDILARLGGEEFIILMPDVNIDCAYSAAERIRKAIEEEVFEQAGKITASFGVAQMKKDEAYIGWYQRVDDALYTAKNSGRNCVVCNQNIEVQPMISVNFEWRSQWNSGNSDIDKQHKELLMYGEKLIRESLCKNSKEKTLDNLEILINYLKKHFEYEELVLKNLQYPDIYNHAQIHSKLLSKVVQLKDTYFNDQVKATQILAFFMDEVIIGHIQEEDTKFYSYLH